MNLWSIIGISVIQTAHGERDRDFVLAIWRHGKRSPMVFQKAFGDDFELWPDGAGQLTPLGVEIHQELGNFLRDRYSGLMSPQYRREELYIRSTDRDRTLLSAVSNLGSFYNVSSSGFVPFPVHTVPIGDDKILRMPVTGCNKYDQIKHQLTNTPLMEQLNAKYRIELDKLGELGKSEEPLKVHTMWPVIDSIDCHIANNLDEIDGVTPELLATWRWLAAKGMESLFTDLEQEKRVEVSRMNGGVLLGDVLSQLQSPLVQPDINGNPVKYLVYSAHDTTLSAALVAMDTWDDVQPYYASALLFERYNDGTIEIFFRNGTSESDLHSLSEKICGSSSCTHSELTDAWRDVIPLSWEAECHNMDPKPEGIADPSGTTLGVFLGISWILFLGYFFWNRGSKKNPDQMSLITSEFSMTVSDEKNSTTFQSVPTTAAYENPTGPI